jgi:hypothetical protein
MLLFVDCWQVRDTLPGGLSVLGIYVPSGSSNLTFHNDTNTANMKEEELCLFCEYFQKENTTSTLRFREYKNKFEVTHRIYPRTEFEDLLRQILCLTRLTLPFSLSFASSPTDYSQIATQTIRDFIEKELYAHINEWHWIVVTNHQHRHLISQCDPLTLNDALKSSPSSLHNSSLVPLSLLTFVCLFMEVIRVLCSFFSHCETVD